ncbi:MAG: hypothetical protein ACRC3G_01180 [Bacteroidales bacterium]
MNFTEKPNFPLASTWLDKQYQISRQLADSAASMVLTHPLYAGKRAVIYSGCEANGAEIGSGYIVYDGVLQQFRASTDKPYLVLRRASQKVTVGIEEYTPYVEYWLELSDTEIGADVVSSVAWSEVVRYSSLTMENIAQELGDAADKVVSQAALNELIGFETPLQKFSVGIGKVQLKKDAIGNVHLYFMEISGFSEFQTFFLLPDGFRPQAESYGSASGYNNVGVGFFVTTNGDCKFYGTSSNLFGYISFKAA